VALIEQEYGVTCTRITLSSWYKQNGVAHAKPNYKLSYRYSPGEMLHLQQQFCKKLMHYWRRRAVEIVFIDECSCNAWDKPGKMWVKKDEPFHTRLAPTRGKSVQIQGAISNRQPEFMWTAKKKNNARSFKALLVKLTPWLKDPARTVYILDNASWHRNPGIKAYLRGKGISVMYLPSSSSVLNPIEQCWGTFKRQLSRTLATYTHEQLKSINFKRAVHDELTTFAREQDGTRYANNGKRYVKLVLDGQVQ